MAEDHEEVRGSPDGASEDGALHDHLAHWVEVLDTWVKRVDLGMGRRIGGSKVGGNRLDESIPQVNDGVDSTQGVEG